MSKIIVPHVPYGNHCGVVAPTINMRALDDLSRTVDAPVTFVENEPKRNYPFCEYVKHAASVVKTLDDDVIIVCCGSPIKQSMFIHQFLSTRRAQSSIVFSFALYNRMTQKYDVKTHEIALGDYDE